jgi:hypothetical protein
MATYRCVLHVAFRVCGCDPHVNAAARAGVRHDDGRNQEVLSAGELPRPLCSSAFTHPLILPQLRLQCSFSTGAIVLLTVIALVSLVGSSVASDVWPGSDLCAATICFL